MAGLPVDLFDFELPPELIAQRPCEPRDAARLLQIGEDLFDRHVRDLPDLLRPDDLLVVNDTRVLPARLRGRRGDVPIELTLAELDETDASGATWRAFARPARRCRPGDVVVFASDLAATDFGAEIVARGEGGLVTLRFDRGGSALMAELERHGRMPLPPYIRRPAPDPADHERCQTRFARHPGAVAAPTAGLHFTEALLARLAARGIACAALTLHVGAGTFLPVRTADARDHVMHAERYDLPEATATAVNRTRAAGGRIVAVGTTALRTLETVADRSGRLMAASGATRLFVTPGYRFKLVDLLLTNFHLPRSTLFMLVSAFAGLGRMQAAYAHARARGYRFYSYGDACLIERAA